MILLTHLKISRMRKKKDAYGLLKYLAMHIDKEDAVAGKAMMALAQIGKPAVEAICKTLPNVKHNFFRFSLLRVLYSICDPDSAGALISVVKNYSEKLLNPNLSSETKSSGETSVYLMAVKTLKRLGINPSEWGISNKPYYDRVRSDFEKSDG